MFIRALTIDRSLSALSESSNDQLCVVSLCMRLLLSTSSIEVRLSPVGCLRRIRRNILCELTKLAHLSSFSHNTVKSKSKF